MGEFSLSSYWDGRGGHELGLVGSQDPGGRAPGGGRGIWEVDVASRRRHEEKLFSSLVASPVTSCVILAVA